MQLSTTAPAAARAFTIEQFAQTFQVSRSTVFEELKSQRLPSYKVGRRRYISTHAAVAWQARLERETAGQVNRADVA